MLEVLVTMLIIAVGLLGLAGLQVKGLQANHAAYLRTEATERAYDMADRMRANIKGVDAGDYNNLSGTPTDPGCITTDCTPKQLADYDVRQWNLDNARLLPLGAGAVCLDSTPDDGTPTAPACDGNGTAFAIKLWWDEGHNGQQKRFVTTFRP